MTIRVEHADMLEAIPRLVAEGVVCDAVVTDPPYHLSATVQRFGGPKGAGHANKFSDPGTMSRVNNSDAAGATARLARGFMGQQWDGGDIAFRPETWATVATILRPGAFLVAFGGTRTVHRMTCAIEDAGFIIQDCLMFLYGTGFPKRRDALKPAYEPIIRARKRLSASPNWDIIAEFTARLEALLWVMNARTAAETVGETDNSARWLVHALQRWSREEFARTDTFSLQGEVSTCLSIALLWNATLAALSTNESTFTTEMESSLTTGLRTLNAWLSEITPASITLAVSRQDGLWPNASTAEVNSSAACTNWSSIPTVFAAEPVSSTTALAILGALADIAASSSLLRPATAASFARCCVPTDLTIEQNEPGKSAPALGVAPFLKLSPAAIQNIAAESAWQPPTGLSPDCQPIVLAYKPGGKRTMQIDECRIEARDNTTKAWRGAGDRAREQYRTGTTGATIATDLGRWPANCVHDGSDEVMAAFPDLGRSTGGRIGNAGGGVVDNIPTGAFSKGDPGFGDSGSAARFFFSAKAGQEDRFGSRHPTVKPVDLIAWLVKLVCPPNGLFLDPFAGSGTAAVAALKTGRNAILIEREAAYYEDIKARVAFYEGEGRHSLAAKARRSPEKPIGGLFAGAA